MTFLPNSFCIKELLIGMLILNGGVEDGLYMLLALSILSQSMSQVPNPCSTSFGFSSLIHIVDGSLCHYRLGILIKLFWTKNFKVCIWLLSIVETYVMSLRWETLIKFILLYLTNTHHIFDIPFVIRHVDIWDPYSIIVIMICIIFFLFADNYTIYKGFFVMNDKW